MTLDICKRIVIRQSEMTSNERLERYREFDIKKRTKLSETIYRDIRYCRMYFLYLKLCLELEKKKIPINDQLIKVNKRLFKDHSLDTILTSSFDQYFKSNKHLFVEEQVKLLSQSETLDKDYLYFKLPKDRTENVMINEIKSLMKNKLKERDNNLFSNSKTPYIRLHIEYNCFIMSVNNYSRREIQTYINEKYENYKELLIQKKKSFKKTKSLVKRYSFTDPDDYSRPLEEHVSSVETITTEPDKPKIHMYEQSVSRVVSRCRKRLINFSENRIFP